MDLWVEVLPEARVRPGAWNLLAVDLWVDVLLEARVQPGAWNLLAVDVWVEVYYARAFGPCAGYIRAWMIPSTACLPSVGVWADGARQVCVSGTTPASLR